MGNKQSSAGTEVNSISYAIDKANDRIRRSRF